MFINYAILFFSGYGYVDFENTKVIGRFSGEGMRFNQRRLRFKLKGLESGVEYRVRCYAYHDDTPDEIGESITTFKIESPPDGGNIVLSYRPISLTFTSLLYPTLDTSHGFSSYYCSQKHRIEQR